MIRPVLHFPDRRLKTPAVPMRRVGPAARRLAADLRDTARAHPGTVGLAAPQIGAMWRMVWVDCTGHRKVPEPLGELVLVDPVAVARAPSETGREGCLSLPDLTADVRRPARIEVRALDLEGRPVHLEATGFEARVILHEIDHLDGVLILDRVGSLARDLFPRRGPGPRPSRREAVVERAAMLARVAHAGRRRGEGSHAQFLEEVVAHVAAAGADAPEDRAAAWLHDVHRAGIDAEDLTDDFGAPVAERVRALAAVDGGETDADAAWLAGRLVDALREAGTA